MIDAAIKAAEWYGYIPLVIGYFMLTYKDIRGWWVSAFGSAIMITYGAYTYQYGIAFWNICWLFINVLGIIQYKKAQ